VLHRLPGFGVPFIAVGIARSVPTWCMNKNEQAQKVFCRFKTGWIFRKAHTFIALTISGLCNPIVRRNIPAVIYVLR
jgi:hypothetical protein